MSFFSVLQCFTLELAIFFQGAVNVPLFDDEARALVGTDFKRKGRYEATSADSTGVYGSSGEKHEKQRGMGRAGWHPEIDISYIYDISWIILDISLISDIKWRSSMIYPIYLWYIQDNPSSWLSPRFTSAAFSNMSAGFFGFFQRDILQAIHRGLQLAGPKFADFLDALQEIVKFWSSFGQLRTAGFLLGCSFSCRGWG